MRQPYGNSIPHKWPFGEAAPPPNVVQMRQFEGFLRRRLDSSSRNGFDWCRRPSRADSQGYVDTQVDADCIDEHWGGWPQNSKLLSQGATKVASLSVELVYDDRRIKVVLMLGPWISIPQGAVAAGGKCRLL